MNVRTLALLVIGSLLLAAVAEAGQYNPVLNIGDPAPAWNDLPGVDGKRHSLEDLKDRDVVVVAFTCNSCPVAVDYEDRLIELAKKYAGPMGSVAVVAINVNRIPADRLPKMVERANEKKFPFPYLYDESQQIARDYGATFTPEFFVLDRDRKIAFMGGMDDDSNPAQVKTKYLEPAIDAVLAKTKPATAEALARGCLIRYERRQRRD
jgi:peroxiredoxin